jgi:MSHA biogenesis protein MshN
MSLINQLLQDLDKRRSQPTVDVQLPQGTHATAISARARMPGWTVWILALLGCALVAAIYVWQTRSQPVSVPDGLLAEMRDKPAIGDTSAVIPVMTQAQAEATLMAPVFQLSNQLAAPPQVARAALSADSSVVVPRRKRKKTTQTPQSKESGSLRIAAVSVPAAGQKPKQQAKQQAKQKLEPKGVPEGTEKQREDTTVQVAMVSNEDAATNPPTPRIAKATMRPVVLRPVVPEETLIPVEVPVLPIARQMRRLTTYELAEIEFRKGVANLRNGRINDAEAQFRLANEEDRSHVAARQALIGILIEAGRNADAEEVLRESLSINPRQPREAMVLARLQVERGDFEAAIPTLESVSAYVGSDAGYYSFLAAVFQRASRHEEAAKQYRTALALMPRNAIWFMGLGISLRALGESGQAQEAFKRAASTGTLSPELQAYVVKQYTELHLAAK